MAAQEGKSYLAKIGDGGGPENFTTFAGMRTMRFERGRNVVEVTNADSTNLARELLTGAGVKTASVSFTGVFTDAAVDTTLNTDFESGVLRNFEIVVPGLGTWELPAVISRLTHEAGFEAEGTFSIELTSGGDWTFTAA